MNADIDAVLLLLDLPPGTNNASEIRKKVAGGHCTGKPEVLIIKGEKPYKFKKKSLNNTKLSKNPWKMNSKIRNQERETNGHMW